MPSRPPRPKSRPLPRRFLQPRRYDHFGRTVTTDNRSLLWNVLSLRKPQMFRIGLWLQNTPLTGPGNTCSSGY